MRDEQASIQVHRGINPGERSGPPDACPFSRRTATNRLPALVSGRHDARLPRRNRLQRFFADSKVLHHSFEWRVSHPLGQRQILEAVRLEHFKKDQIGGPRVLDVMAQGSQHDANVPLYKVRRARLSAVEKDRHSPLTLHREKASSITALRLGRCRKGGAFAPVFICAHRFDGQYRLRFPGGQKMR